MARCAGSRFNGIGRCGKYLVFSLVTPRGRTLTLVGHLGMTGRMYLLPAAATLPKHAAVVLGLDGEKFVFEDTRYFGRLTLDQSALQKLGPEPLQASFTADLLIETLRRSAQPIKVKLLDQSGRWRGSETFMQAKPCSGQAFRQEKPAAKLLERRPSVFVRRFGECLVEAIERGSTVPLDYEGEGEGDGLFLLRAETGRREFLRGTFARLRSGRANLVTSATGRSDVLCKLRGAPSIALIVSACARLADLPPGVIDIRNLALVLFALLRPELAVFDVVIAVEGGEVRAAPIVVPDALGGVDVAVGEPGPIAHDDFSCSVCARFPRL